MADNEKPQEKPKAEAAPAAAQTPAAPAPRQESGSHPAAGPKGGPKAGGKRSWKTVTFAKVFIQSSFNNTIVTITDDRGAVLCWASAGATGSTLRDTSVTRPSVPMAPVTR